MIKRIRGIGFYRWFSQRLVLHPLLFAAAPILSLVASNLQEINPLAGLRALVVLTLAAGFGLVLLQRWIHAKPRAAMLVSLFLLLFFSYGHVYYGLVTRSTHGLFSRLGLIGNHLALGTTWLAFFLAGAWMTLRVKMRLEMLTRVMNLMAIASAILPLAQIIHFELRYLQPVEEIQRLVADFEDANLGGDDRPDIYYLVLDGYGREDTLKELYTFDNGSFLSFLEQHGFVIIRESRSNYVQTSLSVASSLNMNYLQGLIEGSGVEGDVRLTLARMIRKSAVIEFLQGQGYQIVAFASGYRPTELRNANRFFTRPQTAVNPIEGLLLETSAFAVYPGIAKRLGLPLYYPGYRSHRELVEFTLDELPQSAALPSPKFVFAHIVIPHPPFVFDAHGGPVSQRYRFSFMDGDAFQGTEEEYVRGYREQLIYLNQRLEGVIAELLTRADDPPVILLQGDHGPGLQLNYQSAEQSNLQERFGILNALYLPEEERVNLGEGSTPVNTFRLIFNRYFHTNFPILLDRSYYSTWREPLEFILHPSTP
jgi:hypothetical protein